MEVESKILIKGILREKLLGWGGLEKKEEGKLALRYIYFRTNGGD